MSHHVKVSPIRVYAWSPELRVDVSRIVGYRRICSCGARTAVRPSVGTARAAPLEHRG
jgi:hypothetical protein